MDPKQDSSNNQTNNVFIPSDTGNELHKIQPRQSIQPRIAGNKLPTDKSASEEDNSNNQPDAVTSIDTADAAFESSRSVDSLKNETSPQPNVYSSVSDVGSRSHNNISQPTDQQSSFNSSPNNIAGGLSSENNSYQSSSNEQIYVQPGENTTSASASAPKKKKTPARILLLIVSLLIIIGLGGGAYAYTTIVNNSPEKVLADALANTSADLINRKPYKGSGKFTLRSMDKDAPITIDVGFDTKYTGNNASVDMSIDTKAGGAMSVSLVLSGNVVVENYDTLYFNINNVEKTVEQFIGISPSPEITMIIDMYRPMIKKIDGRWIKIDKQSLKELGLNFDEVDKTAVECTSALKAFRLSSNDKKSLRQSFKNNPFAIVSEELKPESIDGSASYHYKLDLNEEAGIKFTKEVLSLDSLSEIIDKCEMKPDELDKELEDLKKKTDKEIKQKPVIEIWINKKTKHINKFTVTANSEEASIETVNTQTLDAKNVKVEIPKDAVKISDLKKELQSLLLLTDGQALGWNSWIKQ